MASINYLLLQTAKNVVILSLIYITLNPVATAGKGRTKTDEVKTTLSPVARFMGEGWHASKNKPTSQRSTDHSSTGTTATPYGKTDGEDTNSPITHHTRSTLHFMSTDPTHHSRTYFTQPPSTRSYLSTRKRSTVNQPWSTTNRPYTTTHSRYTNSYDSTKQWSTKHHGSKQPYTTTYPPPTYSYDSTKRPGKITRFPSTYSGGSKPSQSWSTKYHTRPTSPTYFTKRSSVYPRNSKPSKPWSTKYHTRPTSPTYFTKRSSDYPRSSKPSQPWSTKYHTRPTSPTYFTKRSSDYPRNSKPSQSFSTKYHTRPTSPTYFTKRSSDTRKPSQWWVTERRKSDSPYLTRSIPTHGPTKRRTTKHTYTTEDHQSFTRNTTPHFKRASSATTRSSRKPTKPTTSTTPSADKRRSTTKAPYFCPVHEKSTNRGIFLWPETQAGKTAVLICPHDPSKKATRVCKTSGKKASWKSADYKTCPKLKKNSMEIFNITEEVVDSSNVENIGKKIRQLSKNKLVPDDVANTAVVLERIVSVKGSANEVAVSVFDTVDNILDADDVIVATSQRTSKSSTRIVQTLTNLLEELNTTSEGGSFKKSFKNFIVDVETVDPGSFTGLSFSSDSIGSADNVTKQQDGNVSAPVSIHFPKTLFKNLRTRRLQTLVVTVYKKRNFFNLEGSKDNNKMVNSFIMAGKVKNVTVTNLTDPVVLTFGSLKDGKEDSTECVFWDFDREMWSSDGCRFEGYEDGKAVCHCDHMTNFAMLMDVDKTQDKVHGAVLSIVSYIGCMLSLIGLILTILTILFFRDLRSNAPTQILLNFCLALTLTLIVFLAGAERSKTTSMLWCRVAAIALHYFILATFFWMVMEAINMYLAFVKVMPSYVPQFMLKCMLTAWGIPAIIVAITAGVAYDCYGDEQFCRLNGHPFVFAFLVPVLIILIGNSMAFFVIFRSLVKTGKKTTADLRVTTYQRARHGAAVFVVLGLTWVFGIFAIKDARILFQYLFCIFNSLQGLLVFVLYCLLPQTTRDKYKRFFGVHRLYRMSTRTSSLGESTTRSRTESHETPKTNQVAAAVNTV